MYYSVTRNFAILTQSWWDAKFYICINAFGVEMGSLMVPKIIAQRKALISGEYSVFIRVICLKLSSLTFRTKMDKFVSFIELVVHFLKTLYRQFTIRNGWSETDIVLTKNLKIIWN